MPALSEQAEASLETCQRIIDGQMPNLLRLYLNPWVAQTCLCLNHYAQSLVRYPERQDGEEPSRLCPSFLANSRDEAISGAVKLARYTINTTESRRSSTDAIVFDPDGRFPHFGYSVRPDGTHVTHVPGIIRCDADTVEDALRQHRDAGIVVLAGSPDTATDNEAFLNHFTRSDVVTIRCVDTTTIKQTEFALCDIVLFDESFVNNEVPLAGFTSCRAIFEPWMKGKMSMFHSTTFQPNTIASMHFMHCMKQHDPDTLNTLKTTLEKVTSSIADRRQCYRDLFSPSLAKLIHTIDFDAAEPTASGHYVTVGSRKVFDGVAGVACSLRGHNPATYTTDVRDTIERSADLLQDLTTELHQASGIEHFVPAVSGAAAVEHALQIALTVQQDRNYVLALKGGFGGKTLSALTGTARENYKRNIGPLYPNVIYVDPFADNAVDNITQVLNDHPVGVVQLELIQGVGGVRQIPSTVVDALATLRDQHDFLLFVDEVQTGMFRTGPFLRSHDVGVQPDLVTIGKGASDMMFPFSGTLYNSRVHQKLEHTGSELVDWLRQRYSYPTGCAGLLKAVQDGQQNDWTTAVRRQGQLFTDLLNKGLQSCGNVKDIRVFGMLIGIELDRSRAAQRMIGRLTGKLYSLAMMQHRRHPLIMGFCQYEPHVFKMTPTLIMDDEEIRQVCDTICQTLKRHPLSVLASGVATMARQAMR